MLRILLKNRFLILIMTLALLSSCNKLLHTEPAQSLSPEVVLSSADGIRGLSTSIQNWLMSEARYGRDLTLMGDALADNVMQNPTKNSGRYSGQQINKVGSHYGLWASAWNLINECNMILAYADGVKELPEKEKTRLKGEAYFHRAFAYHDLVKIYGYEPGREVNGFNLGVMIRTDPTLDVSQADDRPRSTNVEVYDLIVSDLENAIDLLSEGDRGVYYANYAAALTLMARVQLYLEHWDDAIEYATQAMSATKAKLVSPADYAKNIFHSTPNPESIMEINIDPATESLGSSDALDQYTNISGYFDILLSPELLNTYEPDDVRRDLIKTTRVGNFDLNYFVKWDASKGPYTDNIPVFRYPELLLIRAESNAELFRAGNNSKLTDAVQDLETLRIARGLSPYTGTFTPDDLIQEVMDENRREFAFEGHRWFDLKRKGMDIPKPSPLPSISYKDFRILAPIPSSEITDMQFINVKQNPEY